MWTSCKTAAKCKAVSMGQLLPRPTVGASEVAFFKTIP